MVYSTIRSHERHQNGRVVLLSSWFDGKTTYFVVSQEQLKNLPKWSPKDGGAAPLTGTQAEAIALEWRQRKAPDLSGQPKVRQILESPSVPGVGFYVDLGVFNAPKLFRQVVVLMDGTVVAGEPEALSQQSELGTEFRGEKSDRHQRNHTQEHQQQIQGASRLQEPARRANPQMHAAGPPAGREAVTAESRVPVVRTFEEDAFHLFALIEAWPGRNADETGRLLAEEFIKLWQASFPEVPKERWNGLAKEFQPKIVAAFRSRAATVCRDHFSPKEVRQLIQFYETPVGRKYARAFTEIVDKMRAGDPQRKAVVDELVDRIRK